jgi:hypothetical protein
MKKDAILIRTPHLSIPLLVHKGDTTMRTIYENYRGFVVSQQDNNYEAIQQDITFSHDQLIEVLNTIDNYVENLDMQ